MFNKCFTALPRRFHEFVAGFEHWAIFQCLHKGNTFGIWCFCSKVDIFLFNKIDMIWLWLFAIPVVGLPTAWLQYSSCCGDTLFMLGILFAAKMRATKWAIMASKLFPSIDFPYKHGQLLHYVELNVYFNPPVMQALILDRLVPSPVPFLWPSLGSPPQHPLPAGIVSLCLSWSSLPCGDGRASAVQFWSMHC